MAALVSRQRAPVSYDVYETSLSSSTDWLVVKEHMKPAGTRCPLSCHRFRCNLSAFVMPSQSTGGGLRRAEAPVTEVSVTPDMSDSSL